MVYDCNVEAEIKFGTAFEFKLIDSKTVFFLCCLFGVRDLMQTTVNKLTLCSEV